MQKSPLSENKYYRKIRSKSEVLSGVYLSEETPLISRSSSRYFYTFNFEETLNRERKTSF